MNKYALKKVIDKASKMPALEECSTPVKKGFKNNYKGKTQDEIYQSLRSLGDVFKK